jgi:hypothetical protein
MIHLNQVTGFNDYIRVPLSIDLFMSHPFFSKLLSSSPLPLALVFIILLFAFYLFRNIIQHKKYKLLLAGLIASICILGIVLYISPLVTIARNPSSSTIIAAIVDDKKTINYLFFKQYYIIVDINGEKHGVITNKNIYSMSKYKKHATFDYTLYTYIQNGKNVMYRFCRPENKVKIERGNLQ